MTNHTENRGHVAPKKRLSPLHVVVFLSAIFGFIGWSLYSEVQALNQMREQAKGPIDAIEIFDESGFIINKITDQALIDGFQRAIQSSDTRRDMRTGPENVTLTIRGLNPEFDHVLRQDGEHITIRIMSDDPMDLKRCQLHSGHPDEIHCSFEIGGGTEGGFSSREIHDWLKSLPHTTKDAPNAWK